MNIFRWHARENKEWQNRGFYRCSENIPLRHNGHYYTPFSGGYRSIDEAMGFYNRSGEFFEGRGVKLMLFCNGLPYKKSLKENESI